MAHEPIKAVRLLPPDIPVACHVCANDRNAKRFNASSYLVCPDGLAIQAVCKEHGESIVRELAEKVGETWTLHPIHHSDKADRTSHERLQP